MGRDKQNQKSGDNTWLRRAVLIMLGLLIGLNAFLINASSIGHDKIPMPLGFGVSVVLSGSMEPEFSIGDLLLVKKQDDYKTGDIVVYETGDMLVVHRIIKMDGDKVITKGDANNTEDAPITEDQIKGVVTAYIPKAGTVVSLIRTPIGILVLLGVAFALVEVSFRRKKKSDEEELEKLREEIEEMKRRDQWPDQEPKK